MRRIVLALFALAVLLVGWWLRDASRTHVTADRRVIAGEREPTRNATESRRNEETKPTAESTAEFPSSIALVGADGESIVVRAIDPRGEPARAVRIVLSDHKRRRDLAEGVTGEDGRFWFEDPPLRRVRVYYLPGHGLGRVRVGTWDPKRPREVSFKAYLPREFVARITVDGSPALPPDLRFVGARVVELERNQRDGLIRAVFLPRTKRSKLRAQAANLIDATATVDHEAAPDAPPVEFALFRRCKVVVHAQGATKFVSRIQLTRVSAKGRHGTNRPARVTNRKDEGDKSVFSYYVRPGRYRLVTPQDLVLREFEVSDAQTSVDLDLRAAGEVEVRVHAPAPFDQQPHSLLARLEQQGYEQTVSLILSGQKFLHPGDRALTVRATSQVLRAHPSLGAVTVLKPGGVAHVHLIRAPDVRFRWRLPAAPDPAILDVAGARFDPHSETPLPAHRPAEAVWLTLYPVNGKRSYAQASAVAAPWSYSFPSPSDGRFALVIGDRGRGCVVLRDVELEGATDLGTLRPDAAHHVTIVARNRSSASSLTIRVRLPDSELEILGGTIHGGQTATVLRAIPAGRWKLWFHLGNRAWSESIECAGGKAQVVEVDCAKR